LKGRRRGRDSRTSPRCSPLPALPVRSLPSPAPRPRCPCLQPLPVPRPRSPRQSHAAHRRRSVPRTRRPAVLAPGATHPQPPARADRRTSSTKLQPTCLSAGRNRDSGGYSAPAPSPGRYGVMLGRQDQPAVHRRISAVAAHRDAVAVSPPLHTPSCLRAYAFADCHHAHVPANASRAGLQPSGTGSTENLQAHQGWQPD
jgi:hypothetical protein